MVCMAGVSFDDIGSGDVMKLEELPIKNGLWVSDALAGSVSKWIIVVNSRSAQLYM